MPDGEPRYSTGEMIAISISIIALLAALIHASKLSEVAERCVIKPK